MAWPWPLACKVRSGALGGMIRKHANTECLAPALETSKTADMKTGDIPITQIDHENKVVVEDRLQSNF
jgi:hypothetical protein